MKGVDKVLFRYILSVRDAGRPSMKRLTFVLLLLSLPALADSIKTPGIDFYWGGGSGGEWVLEGNHPISRQYDSFRLHLERRGHKRDVIPNSVRGRLSEYFHECNLLSRTRPIPFC